MDKKLNIQVIVGSVREGRMAMPVANWVVEQAASRDDIACELLDLKQWDLPFYASAKTPSAGGYEDPAQVRWGVKVGQADGYILIAPEYNHGPSAVLKNALDTVYAEWNRKPVGFVAYGGMGGARSVEQLRLNAVELQMAPLEAAVHLMGVWGKRSGDTLAPEPRDEKALTRLFDEIAWWGAALKAARG